MDDFDLYNDIDKFEFETNSKQLSAIHENSEIVLKAQCDLLKAEVLELRAQINQLRGENLALLFSKEQVIDNFMRLGLACRREIQKLKSRLHISTLTSNKSNKAYQSIDDIDINKKIDYTSLVNHLHSDCEVNNTSNLKQSLKLNKLPSTKSSHLNSKNERSRNSSHSICDYDRLSKSKIPDNKSNANGYFSSNRSKNGNISCENGRKRAYQCENSCDKSNVQPSKGRYSSTKEIHERPLKAPCLKSVNIETSNHYLQDENMFNKDLERGCVRYSDEDIYNHGVLVVNSSLNNRSVQHLLIDLKASVHQARDHHAIRRKNVTIPNK